MHVERIEIDDFRPIERIVTPIPADSLADPEAEGPLPGTVSLIARDGRLRVSFNAGPKVEPRRALISAIRQLLKMPEYRSGAEQLTFARTLPVQRLGDPSAAPLRDGANSDAERCAPWISRPGADRRS